MYFINIVSTNNQFEFNHEIIKIIYIFGTFFYLGYFRSNGFFAATQLENFQNFSFLHNFPNLFSFSYTSILYNDQLVRFKIGINKCLYDDFLIKCSYFDQLLTSIKDYHNDLMSFSFHDSTKV